VGSHRITTGQLQSEVNTSLADPVVRNALANAQTGQALGGDRAGFTRATLSRLISQFVVSDVAAAHHVTVTPQEVTAQQASFVQQAGSLQALQQSAADQVGVGASQLQALLRFTVLQQNLGTALTANLSATHAQLEAEYQKDIDNYDQLQIAQIAVKSNSLAQHLLAKVRAKPSSFASLARRYSTDTQSKSNGGLVGFVGRSQVVQLLGGKAAAAKPGSFVAAHASSQYVVLHIIKRQTQPLSQVVDKVKAALFSTQANTLLAKAVTAEAAKLGVHVSPRYGRWDSKSESVVATQSPTSSPG
jgi:parvulin-like peptidyl-prolyl isomerase